MLLYWLNVHISREPLPFLDLPGTDDRYMKNNQDQPIYNIFTYLLTDFPFLDYSVIIYERPSLRKLFWDQRHSLFMCSLTRLVYG